MKKYFISLIILLFTNLCFCQNTDFTYSQTCYGKTPTTIIGSSVYLDSDIQSWQWDVNGDGLWEFTGKTISVYSFITPDIYTIPVKLKITLIAGATDSITKNVILDPKPNVDFTVINTCAFKQATYTSVSTIAFGSIVKYIWDFNNDLIPDDSSSSTVYNNCGPIGNYSSKLTCVSDKGCKSSFSQTIQVYQTPVVSFSTQYNCSNKNTFFSNASSYGSSNWDFGDGYQSSSIGNIVHMYNNPGNYPVRLIVTMNGGCKDTATKDITIYQSPIASFSVSNTCVGDNTLFHNYSSGSFCYWDFGDGNQINNSQGNIAHAYNNSGNYNVTLIASINNECKDTTTNNITINPSPTITITAPDTIIHGNGQIQLTANGAGNYQWYNGLWNPTISVNNGGTYWVTGTDQNGCRGTASINIYNMNNNDFESNIMVASNIITPNGDGINDYLVISNIQSYWCCNIEIYNMWNQKVFECSDHCYNNDWGGRQNSSVNGENLLPDGAYYYNIQCGRETKKGCINILTGNVFRNK